jgi:M6 family metalloprotease-like protein
MKSTGEVIIKVILVDFPDAQAQLSPQQAFAKVAQSSALFDELSYGRMRMSLQPTYKWYRMGNDSKAYAPLNQSFLHHRAYMAEAIALADADIDFSQTDGILILANPDAKEIGNSGPAFTSIYGNGFTLDGKYIANGATSAFDLNYWGYIWLNHEFGHALGLPDLYAFTGEDSTNPYDGHRYVGEYSLMGLSSLTANSPGFLAWERWLLGWIDSNQIHCMEGKSTSQLITPISRKSGLKAVIVPITMTKVVVIESRRAEGVDKNLKKSGALVYVIDSAIQSGLGPVKIYPVDKSDNRRLLSVRASGESVTIEGVTVSVKKSNDDGDLVEVTVIG